MNTTFFQVPGDSAAARNTSSNSRLCNRVGRNGVLDGHVKWFFNVYVSSCPSGKTLVPFFGQNYWEACRYQSQSCSYISLRKSRKPYQKNSYQSDIK
jgi:hypothetical protein